MTRTPEGIRIFRGPAGNPNGWTRRFVGRTAGEATAALDRCKEVLIAVTHGIPPLSDRPVSIAAWRAHTPTWFLDACAPERSPAMVEEELRVWRSLDAAGKARFEQEQVWTFENWVAWFDSSSDLRRSWMWWDGGTQDKDTFWIEVEVFDDPAALGTLTWMMRAAGAETVTEEPASTVR